MLAVRRATLAGAPSPPHAAKIRLQVRLLRGGGPSAAFRKKGGVAAQIATVRGHCVRAHAALVQHVVQELLH